jgi:hypothetical protein
MWLAFEALVSVYGSARQVEAELSHPLVWRLIRHIVVERFPDHPAMHFAEGTDASAPLPLREGPLPHGSRGPG